MDYAVDENIPGLLIFIYFQKAFDSLEWNFLLRCLESFNFGSSLIRWVIIFYKNIQSGVIDNGIISDFFTLERGVTQGDPLSPYLFVIAAETLAISIRQNAMLKGITIEKTKLNYFSMLMIQQRSSQTLI